MELKTYFRILMKKWWIVVSAFLVTLTTTLALTFTQIPTYRATATYVVAPATSLGDSKNSIANSLDILSRRAEIATTYAKVASSRLIRQEAAQEMNLSPRQEASLVVESLLVAGTNVVEIAVTANDPVLASNFANKVGAKTVAYAENLYDVYAMKGLDQAVPPKTPASPMVKLNLALGAILGLALGGGLVFVLDYFRAPLESIGNLGILDEESGVYNKRYFEQRVWQEMSRAKRNQYPLSLALMNIDQSGLIHSSIPSRSHSEAMRKVAAFLQQHLREEDVLARLEGTTFALLLPDVPEEQARAILDKLQAKMAWTTFELESCGVKLNLNGAAGIAAYNYNGIGQVEFLSMAQRALMQANATNSGKVSVFSEDGDQHS